MSALRDAKFLNLINSARPTFLLVEEAGECLEAQVVASRVPSIQQLILIGDYQQLRPHITSYRSSSFLFAVVPPALRY